MILEVQQNSNTTYRVYDWGRVGHDGRPRDLHIKEAFQCIDWRDNAEPVALPTRAPGAGPNLWWEIIKSPYFHVSRLDMEAPENIRHDGRSFDALFALGGRVAIECGDASATMDPGVSCLMPAGLTDYRLAPVSTKASVIRTRRE